MSNENSSIRNSLVRHVPRPKAYVMLYSDSDMICLQDNDGFIMDKTEMEDLVAKLQITIRDYDKTDIEELNAENNLRLKNEFEEFNNREEHEKQRVRKINKGYVYFITYDNINYKIGMAKDVKKRIKGFSVEMPFEIKVIHFIETNDMWLTEHLFHEYFSSKRCNGEWFQLNAKDIAYILKNKYSKDIMESIKVKDGVGNE